MRLVQKSSGEEVKIGSIVLDHDEVAHTVRHVERPRHGGSTGRIYVEGTAIGHYPSVYGCEWIDREDQK